GDGRRGDEAEPLPDLSRNEAGERDHENEAPEPADVLDDRSVGEAERGRRRAILETMLEHGITSQRRLKTRAQIVKLINRTHNPSTYSRTFAALRKLGRLHSQEGPSGGTWLTPDGKAEAERLRTAGESSV